MNDMYQRCLSTCQQLHKMFTATQTEASDVDVAPVSATRLLYHCAIDTVCCLTILLVFCLVSCEQYFIVRLECCTVSYDCYLKVG